MRKILLSITLVMFMAPFANASNVSVSVGVNVGGPPPVYVNPPVVIAGPPQFLLPPELGFYVAVGVGYDLFLSGNVYYLHSGNVWYSSPYYNGPWVNVQYKKIPPGLRKYPIKRIHYYRDVHYKQYKAGKGAYKYKQFQPKYHKHSGKGYGGREGRESYENGGKSGHGSSYNKGGNYDKGGKYEKGGKNKQNGGGRGHGSH
jgi:hypothetical protein